MNLNEIRSEIDRIDSEIIKLIEKRLALMPAVAEYKSKNSLPIRQPQRETAIIENRMATAEKLDINPDVVRKIFTLLMDESSDIQERCIK